MTATKDTLRSHLRNTTADAHDRLDSAMRKMSGWATQDDYIQFLRIQYAARTSVESWLAKHALAGLTPPPQSPLIASDLDQLNAQRIDPLIRFSQDQSTPGTILGVAWVLAGSALGNRAILKDIRRSNSPETSWPCAFLADTGMLTFWNDLRRRIERPASQAECDEASAAALTVFDHFLRLIEAPQPARVA